jgi:1-deoxy-D-xylulose-5-phosphate synthase
MKYRFLPTIDSPADLKRLNVSDLKVLADEVRDYIIQVVSLTGGHLAPSLGVVDLTLALHYVFDAPKDKIIWDVGHQAYAHKIITGRREAFTSNRTYQGISGFPKITESPYDAYGTGHASTSISAALGIASARDIKKESFKVLAVIGDGSLTGGLAFEGLNNAGASGKDVIVILNDNLMSISPNVGAIHNYLTLMMTHPRMKKLKDEIWTAAGKLPSGEYLQRAVGRFDSGIRTMVLPGHFFEAYGFHYIGPANGHNIESLVTILRQVKDFKGPQLIHVLTQKGRVYKFAEENATRFHGLGAFDKFTGESNGAKSNAPTYTQIFGETITELGALNDKLVCITAAMTEGTGLSLFRDEYPERFFDVGIAESHAVVFAGGLAVQGFRPVVAIYSTFLQRAFDPLIHDIALQNLPVIFALDRAGVVGEDGPTHHGCFDLSYLRQIPNMVIAVPRDENQLRNMLYTATLYNKGPFAIRYPRTSGIGVPLNKDFSEISIGKGEILKQGSEIAILAVGPIFYDCLKAGEKLTEEGENITVADMRFVKPLDETLLQEIAQTHKTIITVEENALEGGFGSRVTEYLLSIGLERRILRIGIPDDFVEHGPRGKLLKILGLTAEGIVGKIKDFVKWS